MVGSPGMVQTPDSADNGWFAPADGATAVGEPPGASTWMLVNEHPRAKALYDITATVPAGKAAISMAGSPGAPALRAGGTPGHGTTTARCPRPWRS